MTDELKTIALSVRDFALPVPRTGSIDAQSGYGSSTLEGQEIHIQVQQKRAKLFSDYEAEVKMSHEFKRGGFCFQIGGRMDGLFSQGRPKIEEIKTTLNLKELLRKLSTPPQNHPYCLQLKTYGYFYWLQHKVLPELTFHLVSTRNHESEDLEIKLDIADYEEWLEHRLDELVEEAQISEVRAERRKEIAKDFPFPFENPRPGQLELIQEIEIGMENRNQLLLQAPTGLGKTVGVLYPALKEALARGQNVIYATPKNSQHVAAENAVTQFRKSGSKLKSLTVTAKSKICFKNEPLCNPEYCEYAKGYYSKVYENDLKKILNRKQKLTTQVFREIGEEYEVCPFELQLEAAQDADTIICDYNYVFSQSTFLEKIQPMPVDQEGKPNLVVDEVHNLPSRAMDYYSPALSSQSLEKIREDVQKLPSQFRSQAEELLDGCIQVIISSRPGSSKEERNHPSPSPNAFQKPQKISLSPELFIEQDLRLRQFLSYYLDSQLEIQAKDAVLRLCFYWAEFTSALDIATNPENKEFFVTYHPHATGGTIKITCCDASDQLKSCYKEYEQVVAFSATVKPFEYYAKLSGLKLDRLKTAEFQSPFSKSNRKMMIIPQISTKYSDRERSYPKVAEVVRRISSLKSGNYFVFFPSFFFMEKVLEVFQAPPGFTILKQEREMKSRQVETVLDHLRLGDVPTLVFAVQGGVFSEGVDYPGKMLIGAFVVGPPLPNFDLEREEMRKYYDEAFGSGFDYAYTYPAMAKAVQAAGRVIRSETDRGIIILIDQRFINGSYSQSMPTDWFEKSPLELVSQSILKEITDFWQSSETH